MIGTLMHDPEVSMKPPPSRMNNMISRNSQRPPLDYYNDGSQY